MEERAVSELNEDQEEEQDEGEKDKPRGKPGGGPAKRGAVGEPQEEY